MRAYIYPLWRKQYYFHYNAVNQQELLAIYHPYSFITRAIYFIWRNNSIIRRFNSMDANEIPFDINILKGVIPNYDNYIWVINIGTAGEEQKTTILLKNNALSADLLFIKIGFKKRARELVKNEILILKQLAGDNLCPQIRSSGENDEYVFLITDAYPARKIETIQLNDDILNILFSIGKLNKRNSHTENNLVYSFCHGDFCPWNILQVGDELKVIDWEMAGYNPLGYDLFTYVFQTIFELKPEEKSIDILNKNRPWIDKYFSACQVADWKPYLSQFALIKQIVYKNDSKLNYQYDNLVELTKQL